MEFFERAHVIRKGSSRMDIKSGVAVKKQLKQMLNAYKKGNNQGIKNSAEQKYDVDDVISVSEYSDVSYLRTEPGGKAASSRTSEEVPSSTVDNSGYDNDHSSSKYDISISDKATEDSLESITELEKDHILRRPAQSQDSSSYSNDEMGLSFDPSTSGSDIDSDISIPSSLQTSSAESDLSDDGDFDPDGALASKILEKLGKTLPGKKRKSIKDVADRKPKKEKLKDVKNDSMNSLLKKVNKKENKAKQVSKSEFTDKEAFTVLEPPDEIDSLYRNVNDVSEDSFNIDSNLDDSLSSDLSSQFISISASDMQSQSLSDVIGEYVNPTVRNLPSEKQNVLHSHSSKYAILDEVMNVDNFEDVSSLVPEIDEELTIEDLTLDTEAQEILETKAYADTDKNEDFEEESMAEDIESTSVPVKLYNGKNNYILVLKHLAELYIHGKVKVDAIGGSVEIFGYTLQDETVDLYAPYCYFAHSIKTIEKQDAFHGLFSRLTSAGLTASEAEEIITTVSAHDAIISLSKLNSPKIDFVDNNFTATELFSRRGDQTPKFLKKAADNLGCSLYLDQPKRVFDLKSCWEQVVTYGMNDHSRGIICGGKCTGKSTLLRYYVNRLLSKGPVLVIDLDPGQAELTVPGNISVSVVDMPMIGPNFTHLRKPEKTLNIGMINTMDNPSRYTSAVCELISYCRSNEAFQSMPWIVNTMGMCNQMGLKFIMHIILQIQPTFLYQIDSKAAKKRFEFELQPHIVNNLCEEYKRDRLFANVTDPCLCYTFIKGLTEDSSTPQKGSNNFTLSPKDERYLNVLAYFGELIEIHRKGILDIVPYEVNIRDLSIGFNVKIPEAALTKVINGKIIAMCQLTAADKGKMFTLGDNALLSHGYGLIRGVDFEKGLLYILTTVPIEELNLVNALVYADWMPEIRGQETELPGGTTIPYRTATVFHQRKLMYPPRRRFNPLQLLKVTRSS